MTTAIETEYAGHRFRSRLEARWAVFFDKLGVKWLYEPQGYELGGGERYLPDFWLPEHRVWAEVKGRFDESARVKAFAACGPAGLPLTYEMGTRPVDLDITPAQWLLSLPVERMLVLGEVPCPESSWAHPLIILLAGTQPAVQHVLVRSRGLIWIDRPRSWASDWDASGYADAITVPHGHSSDAYEAARKARFEHGQSGYERPALAAVPAAGKSSEEILEALRAIVDAAEGRDLTDEEAERYEQLETQLATARRTEQIRKRMAAT